MFRPPRRLLIAPLLGLAVISCNETTTVTDPLEVRRIPQEIVADVDAIVASNTAFAFDVYRQVSKAEGNVFISPFSISTALAMTLAGAAGTTEGEMAAVTHLTLPRETLHPAFGAVLGSLDRGSALGGYRLSLANRLWGQTGFDFEQPFLDITREDYGAEMGRVDFLHEPEACRQEINTWVENRTEGRIQDLFPEGGIDPNTVLALVNAIYFKGNWVTEFDPEETASAPFRVDAGRSVPVSLMHGKFEARTARLNGVQVLELPYRGNDLSMMFLLPESPDGMAALEASLSPEVLATWIEALHETELDIYLPKF